MKDTIEIKGKVYDSGEFLQEKFGVCQVTIYRWVRRGLLPTPRKIGQKNFFDRAAVENLMAE